MREIAQQTGLRGQLLFHGALTSLLAFSAACSNAEGFQRDVEGGGGTSTKNGSGGSSEKIPEGPGGTSSMASGGTSSMAAGGTGNSGSGGKEGSGGSKGSGGADGSGGAPPVDCTDVGADSKFSFFVTSYFHIRELSGTPNGFGGDLRYGGATDGLSGADAICQEIAGKVCHGQKQWRAYLSTTAVNAKDRIGSGPWYDFKGQLVADNVAGLMGQNARPQGGCCDDGVYDELGLFHDGTADTNYDGMPNDDDHDVVTGTGDDGFAKGFTCEDWTSTTAVPRDTAIAIGHSWPSKFSGPGWQTAFHGASSCAAGTNFTQNGPGDGSSIGAGGGYGAIYCFAVQ